MNQVLLYPCKGTTIHLDQYSKVKSLITTLTKVIVNFWDFCKVLHSNDSSVTTSF